MDFIPLIAATALVTKATSFVKFAKARDFNGIATQVVAWGAGIGAAFLLAATQWADKIDIGNNGLLSQLNGASLVLVGTSIASVGSVVYDFKKARDNTDTAVEPPLLPTSAGAGSVVAGATVGVPAANVVTDPPGTVGHVGQV